MEDALADPWSMVDGPQYGGGSMGPDAFRLDGRHALVVGGATGMGAAAATTARGLGADVTVMDVAPVTLEGVTPVACDLRDRASIDAALAAVDRPVDALFSCAGVADGTPGIELVNFIGQRHLIDRLIGEGRMPRGSAIVMISSVAGLGWERQMALLDEFLDTPDFDAAAAWIDDHPGTAGYGWSKQAMCAYVARQAHPFLRAGVRINSIMPGPTDTPLARANADTWLTFGKDFRDSLGLQASTPEEQAGPMAFLCTPAAAHVNGINLIVDAGYVSAGLVGAWDAPMIKAMLGH
jgi:NAD(P)-dependent dehydrogenase (short-subunit alcohol dehydrogenase family)